MAICKLCNATIPDGTELCSNCLDKDKSNESYLDSLLSSVINTAPDVDKIYKKKRLTQIKGDKEEKFDTAVAGDVVNAESMDDYEKDYTEDMADFDDIFKSLNEDDELLSEKMSEMMDFDDDAMKDIKKQEVSMEDDTFDAGFNSGSDLSDDEKPEAYDEDILSLLNVISDDDPVAEEAKAISDMLSGKKYDLSEDMAEDTGDNLEPPTIGEVFSDALKMVSSLNDPENDIMPDLSLPETDEAYEKKRKKEKKKAEKKEKKMKKKNKKKSDEDEAKNQADSEEGFEQVKQPKVSFIKRIFGNVHDEKTRQKALERKKKEEEAATSKDKQESKKGGILSKLFKGKKTSSSNEKEEDKDINDEKQESRSDKRKAKRAERKEKKKKKKEIDQVIDEIEEDEGRINRVGASIVFIFFGLIAATMLVGTNISSYSLSVQHAGDYFESKKYTEAYNEIYGIDLKDEDKVIYDKIMTVMFVNKQLNSYHNYTYLGMYPEALDSLLKGLDKYEKYIEFARMLDISEDLDYVREQILAELRDVFDLSEKEAMEIISIEDREEYSKKIYNIAANHVNK